MKEKLKIAVLTLTVVTLLLDFWIKVREVKKKKEE